MHRNYKLYFQLEKNYSYYRLVSHEMKPGTLISKFKDHQSFFLYFLQIPLTPLKLS